MNRARCALAVAVVSSAMAATVSAGGWAVITVDDLPEYIHAGKPVTIAYTVRQHGHRLLGGLTGHVEASLGSQRIVAAARRGTREGHYVAALTLPSAGDWSLMIQSGFPGSGTLGLLPVKAIDGSVGPRKLDAASRGRQLFVAKGCASCHTVASDALPAVILHGPDLVPHKYQPEYLAEIIANPSGLPVSGQYAFRMPNLELKPQEIRSIVAYINDRSPSRASSDRHR